MKLERKNLLELLKTEFKERLCSKLRPPDTVVRNMFVLVVSKENVKFQLIVQLKIACQISVWVISSLCTVLEPEATIFKRGIVNVFKE